MIEKLEFKGLWYLPSNSDKKVQGILKFDPVNNIHLLELIGSFYDFSNHDGEPIILGVTSSGDEITLCDCHFSSSTGISRKEDLQREFNRKGQPSTLNFQITYFLKGIHIDKAENVLFNSIYTTIFNLDEWVGISGLNVDEDSKTTTITFNQPDPIKISLDNELSLEIIFDSNIPTYSYFMKELTLKQKTRFVLHNKSSENLTNLLYSIKKFQNFLSSSTQSSTRIESIELYSDSFRNEKYNFRTQVKLYTIIDPSLVFKKPREQWRMIFTYNDIKNDFGAIIKNWYKDYEKFEAPFNLVLGQFYLSEYYLETMFINIAKAAESFHAKLNIVNDEPKTTQDIEFNRKRDIVLNVIPDEYKEWVSSKLNNPIHFETRIKYLLNEFSNSQINNMVGDHDKFIKDIVKTRNYLTHYNSSGRKAAVDGEELILLLKRLRLLLICSFLIHSGMNKNLLEKLIKEKTYNMFRSHY